MANPHKTELSEEGKKAEALRQYKEQQLPECNPTVEDLAKVHEAQEKATLESRRLAFEAQDPAFYAYILKSGTGEAKRSKK